MNTMFGAERRGQQKGSGSVDVHFGETDPCARYSLAWPVSYEVATQFECFSILFFSLTQHLERGTQGVYSRPGMPRWK